MQMLFSPYIYQCVFIFLCLILFRPLKVEEMEPITVFNNFHTCEDNVVRIGMEVLSRTRIVANFISF